MIKKRSTLTETILISLAFSSILLPIGVAIGQASHRDSIECETIQTQEARWKEYHG